MNVAYSSTVEQATYNRPIWVQLPVGQPPIFWKTGNYRGMGDWGRIGDGKEIDT